jgi:hypothetical protein
MLDPLSETVTGERGDAAWAVRAALGNLGKIVDPQTPRIAADIRLIESESGLRA